ncbi:MAG TPA: phosphate ABC transporter permease PstA, partial [Salinisphaeraceae bacterium]|nr:phosphate ABC transporter permease PstA [Salinisphaeraceae bacterium]
VEEDPALLGQTRQLWVTVSADVDLYNKDLEDQLTAGQRAAFEDLQTAGRARLVFNSDLFLNGDSKIATHAGLLASIMGTLYVMVVVLLISFPIGVATAIYLEEFAPDNRLTRIIQININNLAAVPSVLYGLLGLAIFINFMGVPRSSALVGGLTLSLMTLPYIIISSRAALLAVPQNIRHGALAMGASRWQAVRDHVLPLALPGILTGTIIGIAQAVGETAPLLLIGMIAFIPEAPTTVMDATTVLPAQIYSWASMPGQGYRALTAAGILILLATVIVLNGVAIILRNHFERRW